MSALGNNSNQRRHIRLKEWGVLAEEVKQPSQVYLLGTDGSLPDAPYQLRTNVQGFLRTGNDLPGLAARRKIVMLGGSFVESIYAHEKDRFPSVAERSLEYQRPGKLEVWNGGYSGSTSLHVFNIVVNKLRPFFQYVDKVVLFTAMSDAASIQREASFWAKDKMYSPIIGPGLSDSYPLDASPSGADLRRIWKSMIAFLNSFEVDVLVVGSPVRNSAYEDDDFISRQYDSETQYKDQLKVWDLITDTALAEARSSGVDSLDLRLALGLDGTNRDYFYDMLHLNSAGHEALGNIIADYLTAGNEQRQPGARYCN